jgi:DNA-binding transcriptional regulator GbsR (MarR family)
MKQWQKIILDPAAHTVLRQLDKPRTKEEIAEETGIEQERVRKLLENLEGHELVGHEVESGIRRFHVEDIHDRIRQLRIDIEDHTVLEIENAVKAGNFHQARKEIHRDPPLENIQKRRTIAKIEALQKLEQLPQPVQEGQRTGRWQSLKGFIPRI